MVTNEETINEMQLKLKAVEMEYGTINSEHKIDLRTIEDVTKIAKFKNDYAKATDQYKQLEMLIKKNKYKLIILDPLISLKEGTFDENSNDNMETLIRDFVIKLATNHSVAVLVAHHSNKASAKLFTEEDQQLKVDNIQMQNLARGASALMGAVRVGLTLVSMPQKIWEKHYEEVSAGKYHRNNLVGLFNAKANYSALEEMPKWLDKVVKEVPTEDGTEQVVTLRVSDINNIAGAAFESFKKKNEEKIINLIPGIKNLLKLDQAKINLIENNKAHPIEIALNEVSKYLAKLDPEFQNGHVKESTINSRIRRILEQTTGSPVRLPNTKLELQYFFDVHGGKTKHKIKISKIWEESDTPF